ncbi:MAG: DUF3810 domain-containing protein [bacterium]|nr:DUF3810 domain-containing protein [bacterium]
MKKSKIAGVLFGISILLTIIARESTGFANWYYEQIYRRIATVFAYAFGWVPFSVVEISLYAIILYVVFLLGRVVYSRVSKKKGRITKQSFLKGLQNFVLFCSILCILYVVNCGVNYHKSSFASEEGFEVKAYNKEELLTVCKTLTKEINSLESELTKDENGDTVISGNKLTSVKEAMQSISNTYSCLKGYYPSPKGLLFSEILSYQDITGIYSPFTVEANYNDDIPEYLQPYTMCHELSHLKGIMREEEANFVAFLACMNAKNPGVKYSGLMHAYTFCMNELINYDPEGFSELRKQLCKQADHDISTKREFWDKYETKIATVSNKVNDVYLKVNAQEEGTNSYNQVTGLILSYYRNQK